MSISRLMQMGAAGAGGESYWILSLWGSLSGSNNPVYDVDVDSDDNIYGTGHASNITTGDTQATLIKVNTDGDIILNRKYDFGTGTFSSFETCTVDTSGNVYAFGKGYNLYPGSGNVYNALMSKINTNGDMQWSHSEILFTSSQYREQEVDDVRSSVYYNPTTNKISYAWPTVHPNFVRAGNYVELSGSTGARIGHNGLLNYTGGQGYYNIASYSDNSGFRYVIGNDYNSTYEVLTMVKASNTNIYLPVFRYQYAASSKHIYAYGGLFQNSVGYVCGRCGSSAWIAKLNNAGSILFSKSFSAPKYLNSVAVDAMTGDIWAVANFGSGTSINIYKFSSTGEATSYYTISSTDTILRGTVNINNNGDVLFSAYVIDINATTDGAVIIKLPSDFSITGSYGEFTISSGDFLAVDETLSTTTRTIAFSDPTLREATPSSTTISFSPNSIIDTL